MIKDHQLIINWDSMPSNNNQSNYNNQNQQLVIAWNCKTIRYINYHQKSSNIIKFTKQLLMIV